MIIELLILILSVLIALLYAFFIPKDKLLQAQFVFLFTSLPAWLLGLCAVEWELLHYPYRELSNVNRTSFIFEYWVLPMVCVHFNARYPSHASLWVKTGYYLRSSGVITGAEFIFERYTMLIKYTGWEWWWTLLSLMLILLISRITATWFFKEFKISR